MSDIVEPKNKEERAALIAETNMYLGNQKAVYTDVAAELNLRIHNYLHRMYNKGMAEVCKQAAGDLYMITGSQSETSIDFIAKNGDVYRANIAFPEDAVKFADVPLPVFTKVG